MTERSSPDPSELGEVIERQRAALKRREQEAVRDLVREYQRIEKRLVPQIERLTEVLAADPDPRIGTVFRHQRADALLRQVRTEMRFWAIDTIGPTVDRRRRQAAMMAIDDAEQLMLAGMGPPPATIGVEAVFTRLPVQAIETIVGTTRSGPLAELLLRFGDVAAERARTALVTGMALGYNPRKMARELKRALDVTLNRATLIARTEINRAHREASRASYRSNAHIVTGYVWRAACDDRTCAACWALHGTEFDLDTPMGAHPACRCALVPKTKTWAELGYPDVPETSITLPRGTSLFAAASPSTQKAVLGPRAFGAYQNGEVDIEDFVKVTTSPSWGTTYTRGSLAEARIRHGP